MILFTHRPSRPLGAWLYESESGGLCGSGQTFDMCKERAEQAARHHLARMQGSLVRADEARSQVFHRIELLEA